MFSLAELPDTTGHSCHSVFLGRLTGQIHNSKVVPVYSMTQKVFANIKEIENGLCTFKKKPKKTDLLCQINSRVHLFL